MSTDNVSLKNHHHQINNEKNMNANREKCTRMMVAVNGLNNLY